jgi:PAS domain S-box-containing protein
MPDPTLKPQPSPWSRSIIALLLALFFLLAFGLYQLDARLHAQARDASVATLNSVATLKSAEIQGWLTDRLNFFTQPPAGLMATQFAQLLKDRTNTGVSHALNARLRHLRAALPEVQSITLHDREGRPRLSTEGARSHKVPEHANVARQVLETKQTRFIDLHPISPKPGDVALAIVAPLVADTAPDASATGYVVYELDPAVQFFPMLELWPIPDSSGETVLVRQEGDELVYLHTRRERAGPPLSLRLPLTTPGLIAAQRVQTDRETITGNDYLGTPVLGVALTIPGTAWLLIAKMDESEIYKDFNRTRFWILAAMVLLLTALLLLGRTVLSKQRTDMRTAALEADVARLEALAARARAEESLTESELRYRSLFQNSHTVMLIIDPADGTIVDCNAKAAEFYGWSHEKLLSMHITDINTLPPEQLKAEMARARDDKRNQFFFQHRKASGMVREVEIFSGPIDIGGHHLLYSIIHDITDRRNAEAQLHKLSLAVEQNPVSIVITNLDAEIEYVNEAFVRTTGYTRAEALGKNPRILQSGRTPRGAYDDLWQSLPRGEAWEGELFNKRKDGSEYVELARISPIRQNDGQITHYLAIKEDVTERRRNIARIHALLEINALADSIPEQEFLTRGLELAENITASAIGFLHFVNSDQETIELVTWTAGALKGCTAGYDNHYPISKAGIWADCFREKRAVVFNDYPNYAAKHGLPEGHAHLQRLISVPVIEDGKVRMMMGVGNKEYDYDAQDIETVQLLGNDLWRIVRRQRVELELRAALQVVEASPVISFRWRAEEGWPVDYVSSNISRWGYGPNDFYSGKVHYAELIHPDDMAHVVAEVTSYTTTRHDDYIQQYRLKAADGEYFWVEDSTHIIRDGAGLPRFYEGVVSDVDFRKRAENHLAETLEAQRLLNKKLEEAQSQLLQSEKMASIGQLAAGVAHEINNPIGFINSNLGTLEIYLRDVFEIATACEQAACRASNPDDFRGIQALKQEKDFDFIRTDIYQLLSESKDGLARVKKIVQDLKDFSRAGEATLQWADLHQGIDSTLNIIWNELKYKCTVKKEYGDLPEIWCIPAQLNQVFMNLLMNAAHAIPEQGEINIRTGRQGEEVFVAISDTGKGIPPENLNRIFDPFFTTKPVGQGTGLGLSLAYSIVKKHQGRIEVRSTVGQGTTFTVWLPLAAGADIPHEA